jgi:hypothetical protein
MWPLIIGAIIGTITSILTSGAVAVFVENKRRPRLKLSIGAPPLDPPPYDPPRHGIREMRFLFVKVENAPLLGWTRWMIRAPALQCGATITFHHLDGQNVFGRTMVGRWSASPEPVTLPVVGPQGQQFQIIDFARLTVESRMDIYPGQTQTLDIAARSDDDQECYGWNNDEYFCTPPWRNPNWRLPKGRYLVRVIIGSSGQEFTDCYRLINDLSRREFRLENATSNERLLTSGYRN